MSSNIAKTSFTALLVTALASGKVTPGLERVFYRKPLFIEVKLNHALSRCVLSLIYLLVEEASRSQELYIGVKSGVKYIPNVIRSIIRNASNIS